MIFRVQYVAGLLPEGQIHEDIEATFIDYDVAEVFQLRQTLRPGVSTLIRAIPYSSVVSIEPQLILENPAPVGMPPQAPDLLVELIPQARAQTTPDLGPMDDEPQDQDQAFVGIPAMEMPADGLLPPIAARHEQGGRIVVPERFLAPQTDQRPRPTPAPETPPPSTFGS